MMKMKKKSNLIISKVLSIIFEEYHYISFEIKVKKSRQLDRRKMYININQNIDKLPLFYINLH
jgi:hypothetical protein